MCLFYVVCCFVRNKQIISIIVIIIIVMHAKIKVTLSQKWYRSTMAPWKRVMSHVCIVVTGTLMMMMMMLNFNFKRAASVQRLPARTAVRTATERMLRWTGWALERRRSVPVWCCSLATRQRRAGRDAAVVRCPCPRTWRRDSTTPPGECYNTPLLSR